MYSLVKENNNEHLDLITNSDIQSLTNIKSLGTLQDMKKHNNKVSSEKQLLLSNMKADLIHENLSVAAAATLAVAAIPATATTIIEKPRKESDEEKNMKRFAELNDPKKMKLFRRKAFPHPELIVATHNKEALKLSSEELSSSPLKKLTAQY